MSGTVTTDGVLIYGSNVTHAPRITIDDSFEAVPVARCAGIPLVVKRQPHPSSPVKLKSGQRHVIVRVMSDPDIGIADIPWQYGGAFGPAPPVLAGRSDGVPFSVEEWNLMDDFEMAMLDTSDGPRRVTRKALCKLSFKHQCFPQHHYCARSTLLQRQASGSQRP